MIVPSDQYHRILDTFIKPQVTCFRINPLRTAPDQVVNELRQSGLHLNRITWYPLAYWIDPRNEKRLRQTTSYREGALYVQNLSSMVPPLVLDPQPGEQVLDLTAAPGSKTVQMAGLMQNQGRIVAVEKNRNRYFRLLRNLNVQGADIVEAVRDNAERIGRTHPAAFDRVLLDTPCSTEGRFRVDDPHTFNHWSERTVQNMARTQRRLLVSAVQALRVGGTLVYSTCSFAPEENEAPIDYILNRFGSALETVPITLGFKNTQRPLKSWNGQTFSPGLKHARRILPTPTMEGFFLCKLVKRTE